MLLCIEKNITGFEVDKKLDGIRFDIGTTEYFNPEASVGVGSQYSSAIVGTAEVST